MPLFPTKQWLTAYGQRLDESDALDELARSWDRDFDGNILYVIEDIPLEETNIENLPDEVLDGIPENIRAGIGAVTLSDAPEAVGESIRPALPDTATDLLEQIENEIHDGTIYAYINLDDEGCTGVELLDGVDERPTDFVLRGPYSTWRAIVDGRSPVSAVLEGHLDIQSGLVRQVHYTPLFQFLGETAAGVETVHLFEGDAISLGEQIFDKSVEQSAFVQKSAQQQFTNMFDNF
jgi:putative sterol carrier protein